MLEQFLDLWKPVIFIYNILVPTAFVWAPLFFFYAAWELWHHWRQEEYVKKTFKPTLYEIRLPKEIPKLPNAMELVYESMYQSSLGTWWDRFWKGRVLPEFSFEIVSSGGNIRFFLRVPDKFRVAVVAAVYAQYPTVEIVETEDYVYDIPYKKGSNEWSLWGTEYKLTKEDAYPIKTYMDFRLGEVQMKEEQKSDPVSSIIEFLGSVPRGSHMWIQIMFRTATTKRLHVHEGSFWETTFGKQDWIGQGKYLIQKIRKRAEHEERSLTKQEQEQIEAITRSIAKHGFDVGIRSIHVGTPETYNGTLNGGLYLLFQPFASGDFNALKGVRATDFDYPWQDYKQIRLKKKRWKMFDAYVRRSYFHPPYKHKPFVLTTEELATIFHFPSYITAPTPTLGRIEAKKVEPPTNLPI